MLKLCNLRRSHAHRLYSLLLIRPLQEKSEKSAPESYAEIAKDPRKNARAELGVLGRKLLGKTPSLQSHTDKGAVVNCTYRAQYHNPIIIKMEFIFLIIQILR